MSDDNEPFEITSFDLENEFNHKRYRKKFTKQQQIYGIWADSDNDSENENSNSKQKQHGRFSKDYTAPVNFVAGGVQQSGGTKENEDNTPITDEEDDDPSHDVGEGSSSEDERRFSSMTMNSNQSKFFAGCQPKSKLASWEQHTKGIGAKLLLQMGYEPGKGLGKTLQGIAQPVEAHMRKGRGAIGAYGPEKPATIAGKLPIVPEADTVTKVQKKKSHQWKKDEKISIKNYRTAQEVIQKGSKSFTYDTKSNRLKNVTVIDMTGPEKRILSGYHALGQAKVNDENLYEYQSEKKLKNFALPELTHNMNLIVDMCEQEIIFIDQEARNKNVKQKQLLCDRDDIKKIVEIERNHLNTLQTILSLVEKLTKPNQTLTLIDVEKIFLKLSTDFPAEYNKNELNILAVKVAGPLIEEKLKNWKPFKDPMYFVETVANWRTLLGISNQSDGDKASDPYSLLLWSYVIPKFREVISEWNPKNHQEMASLLDAWAYVFPSQILDNLLEHLILPRLSTAVEEWDPLTDTIPIHVWILPWSRVLGPNMENFIYPSIRTKLGNALEGWLPQDRSACAMLTPWKEAFGDAEMQSFLIQHIIPKLQTVLNQFTPLQLDLEMWNQVWDWHEIISPLLMAQLLDKYFFPKWMQTLVVWLNQAPNFEQISRWYLGWKSLISEEVLEQTIIKEHFRRSFELIQRVTGKEIFGVPQPVIQQQAVAPPALMDLEVNPPQQLDFRELVSQKCAEKGIMFLPMPGRREFGKQIYRIGKLLCYIDQNVLMVSDGNLQNWQPHSLPSVLDLILTN